MLIEDIIINKLNLKNVLIKNKSLRRIGINLSYRPDILLFNKRKNHYLVLEIDERQHNGYNIEKELIRYIRINSELKSRGIVKWIRFNPDGYISREKYKDDIDVRISKLSKEINKSIRNKDSGIKHMYFSESNKHLNLIKNI